MADVLPLPKPLPEREAAAALGVSQATLARLRRAGRIGCVMVGGRPRYLERHLSAYPRRPSEESRGLEAAPPGATAEETAEQGWVGTHREFTRIQVEGVTLRGVEFGVRGISRPHGLAAFSRSFGRYISTLPVSSGRNAA